MSSFISELVAAEPESSIAPLASKEIQQWFGEAKTANRGLTIWGWKNAFDTKLFKKKPAWKMLLSSPYAAALALESEWYTLGYFPSDHLIALEREDNNEFLGGHDG
ncbi:hypothetical protein BTUL_0037g00080 [Botrytis tulipae]|uniref:Uncharacterized protein n=1 Tax=Botrytis tulipae TaxID=87230 RepID=A0A4Z1F3G0_9HELO|nr:hypothetical protein BTUL_0037g00080 [Botrytis tulipae]